MSKPRRPSEERRAYLKSIGAPSSRHLLPRADAGRQVPTRYRCPCGRTSTTVPCACGAVPQWASDTQP